jgi:hypothetical protein
LQNKPVKGSMEILIAAYGNHGVVGFEEYSGVGREVVSDSKVLEQEDFFGVGVGQ